MRWVARQSTLLLRLPGRFLGASGRRAPIQTTMSGRSKGRSSHATHCYYYYKNTQANTCFLCFSPRLLLTRTWMDCTTLKFARAVLLWARNQFRFWPGPICWSANCDTFLLKTQVNVFHARVQFLSFLSDPRASWRRTTCLCRWDLLVAEFS
jgi:hypothetical protein